MLPSDARCTDRSAPSEGHSPCDKASKPPSVRMGPALAAALGAQEFAHLVRRGSDRADGARQLGFADAQRLRPVLHLVRLVHVDAGAVLWSALARVVRHDRALLCMRRAME